MRAQDLDYDRECPACSGTGQELQAHNRSGCPFCNGAGTNNRYQDVAANEVLVGPIVYEHEGTATRIPVAPVAETMAERDDGTVVLTSGETIEPKFYPERQTITVNGEDVDYWTRMQFSGAIIQSTLGVMPVSDKEKGGFNELYGPEPVSNPPDTQPADVHDRLQNQFGANAAEYDYDPVTDLPGANAQPAGNNPGIDWVISWEGIRGNDQQSQRLRDVKQEMQAAGIL